MRERLSFAFVGLILGALTGAVVWWLSGPHWTFHRRLHLPDLLTWLKYSATAGAVAGFVLKDRVGDLLGGAIGAVYEANNGAANPHRLPLWVAVLLVAALVFIVIRFLL